MPDGSEKDSPAQADTTPEPGTPQELHTPREPRATQEPRTPAVEPLFDRNTRLAIDRTALAAERTYAAWVRTGLAAVATGVGAHTLLLGTLPSWFGTLTGSGLILFGAFCFTAAVWRELAYGASLPAADIKRLPVGLLLTINGLLVVLALAALVGIWLLKA